MDTEDYDYNYSYDGYEEAEVPVDLPLEENEIELEEEEEEISIDEGFLNDVNIEAVEIPQLNTKRRNGSVQFFFVLIGGLNADGLTINND